MDSGMVTIALVAIAGVVVVAITAIVYGRYVRAEWKRDGANLTVGAPSARECAPRMLTRRRKPPSRLGLPRKAARTRSSTKVKA
jgi:hypothetical protein